jgi:hypothetical protein
MRQAEACARTIVDEARALEGAIKQLSESAAQAQSAGTLEQEAALPMLEASLVGLRQSATQIESFVGTVGTINSSFEGCESSFLEAVGLVTKAGQTTTDNTPEVRRAP